MDKYIGTPQASDASFFTKALDNLDSLSPEKSFAVPARGADLISQMRSAKGRGMNLKTPRAGGRDPLRLLPNGEHGKPEFTPLMRSVTKNNIARRLSSKKPGTAYTPRHSLLKPGDLSTLDPENTSSSAGNMADDTPMPHQASSAQSTPLAQLPTRDAVGLVSDGNMMTLREQENIIDKIEKENFGLKMKIHFLEEALSKRGGEFNQAALKENTDLKVNRITMQRELHKFKKNIAQAEKDAEVYRLQLEEFKERIRRKQVDESVRVELHKLRSEVEAKDKKLKVMERESSQAAQEEHSQIQKLKDELDDLQAELREKDRLIDERDDQIDSLKAEVNKDSNEVVEVEEELRYAKEEVEHLKQTLDRVKSELQGAKEEREEAIDDKRRAEENLDELRDEMANKSFTTKGLSRQLEEKANKLDDDFQDLQERYEALQAELDSKSDAERQLRDRVRELEKEGASETRKAHQELELSQQQRDTLERKLNNMAKQLETAERDLQEKTDEKDLLQSRHDALTRESAELQKDLVKLQKAVRELEKSLEEERQQSAHNDNLLRTNHKHELDLLNEQIDGLHREVNSKENAHAADLEEWEAQKHSLESASQKAEEKAKGLQRTVDKLQDAQGTLSGREMKLQEALESENERHKQEEKILSKEIQELQQDLTAKRQAADESRNELNNAREELRISIREQASLKEKVVELEDEIEILQADIEQEHEVAQMQQQKSSSHADAQVQKLRQEKQSLQEQLANANTELKDARSALNSAERDREELEKKFEKMQNSNDDTFNIDQEKRELKRAKVKLEKEVMRLTSERDVLTQANNVLENEINSEMDRANEEENRLNTEIETLRKQKSSGTDIRDRELTSARNKVARLESRVKDLEQMVENQSKVMSPATNVSVLRDDLTEARENLTSYAKRETELKASNRDLKMRVNDLEKDLHEARLSQYRAQSPSVSPPPSHSKELAQIRQNLIDAQREIKVVSSENRELKRAARRSCSNETEFAALQTAARSRLDEVESLNEKLSEQNKIVDDLREKLELLQEEHDDNQDLAASIRKRDRQIQDLKQQVKHLREEQGDLSDVSIRLSAREGEAQEMKRELRRLRDERSLAKKRADEVGTELDALQSKYEGILEKLSSGKSSKDDIREKEMRGLVKEIMWLKAKCKREERLRKDLAWSKGFLEQGEVMRSQCNQVDLRILGEMGVSLEQRKYESKLRPVQKFRAGVFAVIAAIRMSNMEESWREAKIMGEELRLMRTKQSKSRTRVRILEV
ncbi:uncharacterized protein A1O9_00825 [Exophiala aquamarina CBS 119918]|uniref:Centrosomin N-terminal motif 1 domain-containing protein n=1 Tax=Exophiala aquamarina CBS 119918 TaxID=1182545 RepID=A0A072PSZ4_9EURO|nr:uncharacterized protein A1O9_00825 [Exophiala aquamarina CBS 119918]KEF62852.1 hypothetical protein A1O9_00825 [Exophiala aquamarina CBS 119918]